MLVDNDPERSYEPFSRSDLLRLAEIAAGDRRQFFLRNPKYSDLEHSILAVALCQGAAMHFLDGRNGIKDIDVWTFYGPHPTLHYPARRPVMSYDFCDPKFGKTADSPHFTGRRVDCLARSVPMLFGDATSTIRRYLSESRTSSARELARKAVVMIQPMETLGAIVLPPNSDAPLGWRG